LVPCIIVSWASPRFDHDLQAASAAFVAGRLTARVHALAASLAASLAA
jgi:hypothetical protein